MLYTKPIDEIRWQDVVEFCRARHTENSTLDYKQEIQPASLTKTIAAMANTWGGLIIVGIEDEDSKPKLPIKGFEYKEGIREQINNSILGNIMPPIFPEVQVCQSKDKKYALAVIRISQSNLTPHAMNKNTKVYLRTNLSNEPEEIASVDRVLWLVDRRKKAVDLREFFYARARERSGRLMQKNNLPSAKNDVIFSMSTLFPINPLIDYKKLRKDIFDKIYTSGWGNYQNFPTNHTRTEFNAVRDGAYSFVCNKDTGFFVYEEINHFGFFYHREDMCSSFKKEGSEVLEHNSSLLDILWRLDLFIESMLKFYTQIGYWGLLECKLIFNEIGELKLIDLPLAPNELRIEALEQIPMPADNKFEIVKELSVSDLKYNRVNLLIEFLQEISWAFGLPYINKAAVERQLREHGRLDSSQ